MRTGWPPQAVQTRRWRDHFPPDHVTPEERLRELTRAPRWVRVVSYGLFLVLLALSLVSDS
jgi:hypothetical protein